MQRLRRFLLRWMPALLVLGLVALPLLGIGSGLMGPSPAGVEAVEPLDQLIVSSGVLGLLLRSLLLGAAVAVAALILGTWLAWLEQRSAYPGRRLLAIAALLPLAVPSYLLAAVLRHQFSPDGLIGGPLGLPAFTGMVPAAITLTIITTPLVQLLVGSALARSSATEEEAARSLGASGWRRFRHVCLPHLRPAWGLSLLLVALYVVADFGAVAVLDCPVLSWRLYQALDLMDPRQAAVLGSALLLATIPLMLMARLVHGPYHPARRAVLPRPAPRRRLARGWWPLGFTLHGLLLGLGVLLPLVTLSAPVFAGPRDGDGLAPILEPLRHSLFVAGGGSLVVLALALVLAAAAAGRRARAARLVDHGVSLTGAVPGIVFGCGLLLAAGAGARVFDWPWLQNGGLLLLLMLGYAARFLPEAYTPLRTALLQSDPRQEDTARTLGASRLRRLRVLQLPALVPGAGLAALLVFVAILKELPITLLVGGALGLSPLSSQVWDRYRAWDPYPTAVLPDVGLAGLLLLGFGLAAVVLSLRFRRHV